MSCGTCSEKTKAGAAAATGGPVATGAAAQPRHCPKCGKFLPKSGQCLNCDEENDDGTEAVFFIEDGRLRRSDGLSDEPEDEEPAATMFVTAETKAALKLAKAVAALDPKAIPAPEPRWPGDKDAGIHIDLPDGYFIRTFKHTMGRTFAEVSQIGADHLSKRPNATKGLSVYVGRGGDGHPRAVKALIRESKSLSEIGAKRAGMERKGFRQCERCGGYVDADGAGHTPGCDDGKATAVTLAQKKKDDARAGETSAAARHSKPQRFEYCDNCGATMSRSAYKRGQGLCPACVAAIN